MDIIKLKLLYFPEQKFRFYNCIRDVLVFRLLCIYIFFGTEFQYCRVG